jgi:hypothetical protein
MGSNTDASNIKYVEFHSSSEGEDWPWIQIEGDDVLMEPGIMMDTAEEIQILFEYPLTNPDTFSFFHKGGWTRGDFLTAVRSGYDKIYTVEAETSSIEVGRASPELINRNITNGTYGIWGHVLSDLSLDRAYLEDGIWHLVISS